MSPAKRRLTIPFLADDNHIPCPATEIRDAASGRTSIKESRRLSRRLSTTPLPCLIRDRKEAGVIHGITLASERMKNGKKRKRTHCRKPTNARHYTCFCLIRHRHLSRWNTSSTSSALTMSAPMRFVSHGCEEGQGGRSSRRGQKQTQPRSARPEVQAPRIRLRRRLPVAAPASPPALPPLAPLRQPKRLSNSLRRRPR